ncbi:Sigma factor regulator N-terminal [Anaerovirgula multivorans]|uniref:Sigma factor regulator N-terminal n=1 Tax=Anaerovirgula multivorans TaxID=312168 RepID=A0A239DA39_9FIRM|nr:anti-sigma factor [Anaerovirgula multivorans]SNS29225.1 Sigma factor regulator N-terminal [Anaerovirgula multivorans]
MKCSDVEKNWQEYLEGSLDMEKEKEIENHINSCKQCNNKLDNELEKNTANTNDREEIIREEKQIKILKTAKWKNRFSTTASAISTVVVITLISGLLSGIFFGLGGRNSRAERMIQTANMVTELTMPNVTPGSGGSNIKSFFRMESNVELRKRVGREEQSIGRLKSNMFFNWMNVERDWSDGSLDVKLYFVYPEISEEIFDEGREIAAWNTLEILPEGTVSELAVSFDKSYSLEEAYNIFGEYDLDLLWFAVDTGVETDLGRGEFISVTGGLLGFPHFAHSLVYEPESPGNHSMKVYGDEDKKTTAFIRGLEFLVENEAWAQKAYRGNRNHLMLQERLDYVTKNGVKIYGVVVTGPTKELLSLKEVEEIRFPVVGEVDWWNWESRYYRGTIYN